MRSSTNVLFLVVVRFDKSHFNSIVLPFRDQREAHHAHTDLSCSWMRCILGNLFNECTKRSERRSKLSA